MNKPGICVISGLGEKKYAEKYLSLSEIHKSYWKGNSLMHGDTPVDVLDYYHLCRYGHLPDQGSDRHVYVNGIIIKNYLLSKGYNVELYNSIKDLKTHYNNINGFDGFILSTSFEGGNYPVILKEEIDLLRDINPGAQIFVGGLGLYNAYLNYKSGRKKMYESLICLSADYFIVSPGGLDILYKKLKSKKKTGNLPQIIVDEFPGTIPYDYSIHTCNPDLQSPHSVIACSKGCPFNCSFCCYHFIHKKYIEFPLQQIKKNIDQITSGERVNPLKFLRISDECLNYDENRFIHIIQLIKRKNLRWCCFLRGDLLSDKSISALAESNCDFVSMGLESSSADIQKRMNKTFDLDNFCKNILKLNDAGVTVVISVIIGFYGETEETIKQTVEYLYQLHAGLIKVNVWSPLPDEKNNCLAKEYELHIEGGKWRHRTMSLDEAYTYTTQYFHKDKLLTVLPPETSIFDQWPQLAAEGLTRLEILELFRAYHIKSIIE